MVEAAKGLDSISSDVIDAWRVWASVGDLAFEFPAASGPQVMAVGVVLARARSAIEAHGDVRKTDLIG